MSAATRLAAASMTCSQLSSSSMCLSLSPAAKQKVGLLCGLPRRARSPRRSAPSRGHRAAPVDHRTPCSQLATMRSATPRAVVVLPMPPDPTIVTRRWRENARRAMPLLPRGQSFELPRRGRLCGRRRSDNRGTASAREDFSRRTARRNSSLGLEPLTTLRLAPLPSPRARRKALTWIFRLLLRRTFAAKLGRTVLPCRRPPQPVRPGRQGCQTRGRRAIPASCPQREAVASQKVERGQTRLRLRP